MRNKSANFNGDSAVTSLTIHTALSIEFGARWGGVGSIMCRFGDAGN